MKYNFVIITSSVIFFLFSFSTNAMKRVHDEDPVFTGFTGNFSAGIYNIIVTLDDEAKISNSIIVDTNSSSMFSPTSERKKLLMEFVCLTSENYFSLNSLLESASKKQVQVKAGKDLEENINFVFTVLPSYTNHLISLMTKKQNGKNNEEIDGFLEEDFYIYGSDPIFDVKIANKLTIFWNIVVYSQNGQSGTKETLFRWTDLYFAGLPKANSTNSLLVKKTLKKFIELQLSGETFGKFKEQAYDFLVRVSDRYI